VEVLIDDEFFDGNTPDQMLIDDAFKGCGSTRAIPHTIGVDDGDGALLADAKAVCLGAIDFPALREVEFSKTFLEIFP
jgi:hypothetical protein